MIRIAIKWSFEYIERLVRVSPFKVGSIIYRFTYLTRTFLPSPPPPPPPPPHGLDPPSASTLGNTAQTRWSLRLLSFLKPVIGTFVKTALWATSGVSKRCNSAKSFLTFWKTG